MAQAVGDPAEQKEQKKKASIQYNQDMLKELKLNEIDVPECGQDQILIKVHSVSLNPVDWGRAMGYLQGMTQMQLDVIIGVIVKKNENILGLFRDRRSFSEYVATTANCVCHIVHDLGYDTAAPLISKLDKRHTSLKDKKDVQTLIIGGSGSCGLAAIQILNNQGAKGISTTSRQVDLCTKLSATKVYNYKGKNAGTWDVDLKDKQYDILFDYVGGKDSLDLKQNVLKDKDGVYISVDGGGKPRWSK